MELNLSTIILEIINFLVLVWILKRFLYHPVLNIIDKRKHDIEDRLEQARLATEQAETMQQQYDLRLQSWNVEQQRLRDQFNKDLATEREKRINELELELNDIREKARQSEKLHNEENQRQLEYRALTQANQFSAKLLGDLACPGLQDKLVTLLLDKIEHMNDSQLARYRHHWTDQEVSVVKIESAYPLNDQQKIQLQKALKQLTQLDLPFEFRQQSSLLAGLKISVGGWVIHANLESELLAFVELKDVSIG